MAEYALNKYNFGNTSSGDVMKKIIESYPYKNINKVKFMLNL